MFLKEAPEHERRIGLIYYQTVSEGIGGVIRAKTEDFIVEEIDHSGNVVTDHLTKEVTFRKKAKYVYYVLIKKNIDTLSAIRITAKFLGLKPTQIGFAGLKDTNAMTYQLISMPYKESLPEKLSIKNVKIIYVGVAESPIRKGLLMGNKFKIYIRKTEHSKPYDTLKTILSEIKENGGLYPYYGHQRFGMIRSNTHIIGKYLVLREWKKAVLEIIGHPFPKEHPDVYYARKTFEETLDAAKALKLFPKKFVYERILLKSLINKPNNYLNAIKRLPKQILQLYIGAYQSYIFNKYVSLRLEQGIKPLEAIDGDLIVRNNNEFYVVRNHIRKISKEEKIALPIIGSNIRFVKVGDAQKLVMKVLSEEDVEPKLFNVKELSLKAKGAYRYSPMEIKSLYCSVFNKDVYLEFILDKGCYATVFLREIMKNENVF